MGINYQLHRVSVDMAKGYQQLQKASNALAKDEPNRGVEHLNSALNKFDAAVAHAAEAEDDASKKVGDSINKGNAELKKGIEAYADGNLESAAEYVDKASADYGDALDLID